MVLNALDAHERGAEVLVGTRFAAARRDGAQWHATLEPAAGGPPRQVRARALVNAAGPWVEQVLGRLDHIEAKNSLRLVKGSHIVVPRLYDGEQAYIFQNDDRRIVFAIPYEGRFSLIGTTDVPHDGPPHKVRISAEETDYLCRAVNRYLKRQVAPSDVVWSQAGVRPLYDDASSNAATVTREYVLELEGGAGEAPLLSIFGGKITTSRKLAEAALAELLPHLGEARPAWTERASLPGGDLPGAEFAPFLAQFQTAHPWLPAELAYRYARAYGTRAERLLDGRRSLEALGQGFGAGLYEAELDYLRDQEWARTADDVLWRRSKLGLHLDPAGYQQVAAWHARQAPVNAA